MQACEKIARGFLVARGDGPKMLDCIEEPLDEVALGIEREVAIAFDLAPDIRPCRWHRAIRQAGTLIYLILILFICVVIDAPHDPRRNEPEPSIQRTVPKFHSRGLIFFHSTYQESPRR
jgi:hypothetical protein